MPIYEYRCDNGHIFEVMQRMTDDPVDACETCSAPVQRVFHPVAVHFKGSGFYNTDYGKRKRGASGGADAESTPEKPAEKKDSKAADASSKSSSTQSSSSGASSSTKKKD